MTILDVTSPNPNISLNEALDQTAMNEDPPAHIRALRALPQKYILIVHDVF